MANALQWLGLNHTMISPGWGAVGVEGGKSGWPSIRRWLDKRSRRSVTRFQNVLGVKTFWHVAKSTRPERYMSRKMKWPQNAVLVPTRFSTFRISSRMRFLFFGGKRSWWKCWKCISTFCFWRSVTFSHSAFTQTQNVFRVLRFTANVTVLSQFEVNCCVACSPVPRYASKRVRVVARCVHILQASVHAYILL